MDRSWVKKVVGTKQSSWRSLCRDGAAVTVLKDGPFCRATWTKSEGKLSIKPLVVLL